MTRTIAACFILFSLCVNGASAAGKSKLEAALDDKAPQWLKQHKVPSVAIAYIQDGALVWTAVYGEQSSGVPATKNTLYNIASLAKPISAEVVLRLASEGKLSLDEPMSPYWIDPDIKNEPRHAQLTPRLSLSHRTGFPNWRYQTNKVLKFQFDPGTKSQYSGEGYQYVARFAQNKIGEPFDALAQHYVFDRIGMTGTSFRKRDWFRGRVASPQGPEEKFGEPEFQETWNAADDVYTTTTDYAKFLLSVMNNEQLNVQLAAERLSITDDARDEICGEGRLSPAHCPLGVGFGLGWAVFKYPSETVVTHDGSDWGTKTYAFYVPERRLGAVVLTNGEHGNKVIREVMGELYPNEAYLAFLTLQSR